MNWNANFKQLVGKFFWDTMTKNSTQLYLHSLQKNSIWVCVNTAFGKFGIKVWLEAERVKDRTENVEFTGLELEDERGFPVNSPD